jgi:hypothetical protein
MIKIKVTEIEVNKEEFIQELKKLGNDLFHYTSIKLINKKVFNDHFKTKLSELEFSKLINGLGIDELYCTTFHYDKRNHCEIRCKEVCLSVDTLNDLDL